MTIENNLTKDIVIKASKKGLKLIYTNADQFVNKRDDLHDVIAEDEPDIIMIMEVIQKIQVNILVCKELVKGIYYKDFFKSRGFKIKSLFIFFFNFLLIAVY